MYRLINYFFGFVIIYLFILEAGMNDHALIVTGLVLSGIMALVAFLANWITLDATKAVAILGTIVLGFGGWMLAAAMIFFFVSGSLLTKRNYVRGIPDPDKQNNHPHLQLRRDGYQVWANGFWVAVPTLLWFFTGSAPFLMAAFAVIATATADTWATELGSLQKGKTRKITTFEPVPPGTDGGVSLRGTTAGLAGAGLISMLLWPAPVDTTLLSVLVVLASSLAGFVIDSLLGAVLMEKTVSLRLPSDFSGSDRMFLNSIVNWMSTGFGGILAFLILQIL